MVLALRHAGRRLLAPALRHPDRLDQDQVLCPHDGGVPLWRHPLRRGVRQGPPEPEQEHVLPRADRQRPRRLARWQGDDPEDRVVLRPQVVRDPVGVERNGTLLSYNPFDLLYCFEVLNSTSFQCLFKCSHGLVKET